MRKMGYKIEVEKVEKYPYLMEMLLDSNLDVEFENEVFHIIGSPKDMIELEEVLDIFNVNWRYI